MACPLRRACDRPAISGVALQRGAGDEAEWQILSCGDASGMLGPAANRRVSLGARCHPTRRPQPLRRTSSAGPVSRPQPQNRCRSPAGDRVRQAHQANHVRSQKTACRSTEIRLIIGSGESLPPLPFCLNTRARKAVHPRLRLVSPELRANVKLQALHHGFRSSRPEGRVFMYGRNDDSL
jgi:hypothetical protein